MFMTALQLRSLLVSIVLLTRRCFIAGRYSHVVSHLIFVEKVHSYDLVESKELDLGR